jgi:hypothetical protein
MAQISLIFVFISVISVNQRPIFIGNAHGNTSVEHRVYGRAAGEMLPIEQPDAVNRRLREDIRA